MEIIDRSTKFLLPFRSNYKSPWLPSPAPNPRLTFRMNSAISLSPRDESTYVTASSSSRSIVRYSPPPSQASPLPTSSASTAGASSSVLTEKQTRSYAWSPTLVLLVLPLFGFSERCETGFCCAPPSPKNRSHVSGVGLPVMYSSCGFAVFCYFNGGGGGCNKKQANKAAAQHTSLVPFKEGLYRQQC